MASIEVNFDEAAIVAKVEERLIAENAELKRLLGQALTDFEDLLSSGDACYFCGKCGHCTDCEPEWRYAAEAEKLLGGGEKENPDKPRQEE